MMVRGRPSRRCEGLAGRHSASHRGHPWRSCDRERPRDRERSHARVSPPRSRGPASDEALWRREVGACVLEQITGGLRVCVKICLS